MGSIFRTLQAKTIFFKFASLLAILCMVLITYACDSQDGEERKQNTADTTEAAEQTPGMSTDMSENEANGIIMAIEPPTFIADSMEMARITITNNTDEVLTFGERFHVEESSNGEWNKLDYLDEIAFNDIAMEVQAGQSREMSIDLRTGDYYTFDKGLYRLCKQMNMNGTDTTLCTQFRVE
ncbi:immunoglobulin-like domain-containing protein [Roseivirga sp. BDSF3-8]|uniref:immunoglobulin-like domain-containing protein n=1 Tax=Roseivirga sp. BDSF3-8 TaxID=3241598 RepID=UPI003531943A